jgi:hypothetical protein
MKRELKELEERLKALRAVMTEWGCFTPDDEVDQALTEVEEELEKFRWK